jgi:hypothetical protein
MFSYYNVTDNVDVTTPYDPNNPSTSVIKTTNPFNLLQNSILQANARLYLPTRMVTRSVTHEQIKLAIKHPNFSSSGYASYWDTIFTDKANVTTTLLFECNIGTADMYDAFQFDERHSNLETAHDFTFNNLLPSSDYTFRFLSFRNVKNYTDVPLVDVLRFDSAKYPKEPVPSYTNNYMTSDYTETTDYDRVNLVVSGGYTRELLSDDGQTRLILENIDFQTVSGNLVYDASIEVVVPDFPTDVTHVATKEGLTGNADFALTFGPEEFTPPLFHFDEGNVRVSFTYANINWDTNGYYRPTQALAEDTLYVLDQTDGILRIDALRLVQEPNIYTLDVRNTSFLIQAPDRMDIRVPNIADFVSHPNLTDKYLLTANVYHEFLPTVTIDIPFSRANYLAGSDYVLYDLNNLLPNSLYKVDLLTFTHLDSSGQESNVYSFFDPFTPKSSGLFNMPPDNVSVAYDTITPVILNDEGHAGFFLDNASFHTDASSQNYAIHIKMEQVIIEEVDDTTDPLTVIVPNQANIQDRIDPLDLSFGTYRLTLTYTNTTYNVPVKMSRGVTYTTSANVENVFNAPNQRFNLQPLPLPVIRMSSSAPDNILIEFDYTHPFEGMSNVYDASLSVKKGSSEIFGFTIDERFLPRTRIGLIPNTLYNVEMTSFEHNKEGVSNILFDTSLPSANVHTASDNVEFAYETLETILLNDNGDMRVRLTKSTNRVYFFTHEGNKSYRLEANINGEVYTKDDINAYIGTQANLDTLFGYTFKYFETYQVTFQYKNTTDTVYALDGPSGNVVTDPIELGTRDPLNVPMFAVDGWSITQFDCTFDSYIPNVPVFHDAYRYAFKAVSLDHEVSNVGYTVSSASALGVFSIPNLYPSRTYTITYDQFDHLKADGTKSGIVVQDFSTHPNVQQYTSPDNFTVSPVPTVDYVLLNDLGHTQIVVNATVTNKIIDDYRANIQINNSELQSFALDTRYLSNVEFNYFESKIVSLAFVYFINDEYANVLDGRDGDPVAYTFPIHQRSPIEPPRITLTHGEYLDIQANLDFFDFTSEFEYITDSFVIYLRLSEKMDSEGGIWTEVANEEIPFTSSNLMPSYTFQSELPITPGKRYKVDIASFVHNVMNSGLSLSTATNEATITAPTENVVLVFDQAYSDQINASGDVNLVLENFDFQKGTGDFAGYTYNIHLYLENVDTPGSNVEHVVDEANLSNIGIIEGIRAHATYNVYANYQKQGESVFVSNVDGSEIVTTYPEIQLEGPTSFDAPRVLVQSNVGVTSVDLQLQDFSLDDVMVPDAFIWTLMYTDEISQTEQTVPFGSHNWDAVLPWTGLRPNGYYHVFLSTFRHTDDPDGNVVFGNIGVANVDFSTESDNVEGTLDIANVSRDLLGDTGEIGTLVFPGFQFHTDALDNEYIVNVDFKEGSTSVFNDDFFVSSEIRVENPGISYFEDSNIVLTYKNFTHGNIDVLAGPDTFILPGAAPFESPKAIVVRDVGPEYANVQLDTFDKHPNISDNFEGSFVVTVTDTGANTAYPFNFGVWDRYFVLSNLEPNTEYGISLYTWAHVSDSLYFDTPTANFSGVRTSPPVYLALPAFTVTDIGYTTISVAFQAYTPRAVDGITDEYMVDIRVSDTNTFVQSNLTAANIGNIEHTFEDLLPGNDYVVTLFAFANAGKSTAVDPAQLPKSLEPVTTLTYVEPVVSLSSELQTTLMNDQGHLAVTLDGFSYASEVAYDVHFVFLNVSSGDTSNIILYRETSFESIESLVFAPELFAGAGPLLAGTTYSLSIRYYLDEFIRDSTGNIIEYTMEDAIGSVTFRAPQHIIITDANVESMTIRLTDFTPIAELNDLYRANIEFVSVEVTDHKRFVADSANMEFTIDNLTPYTEYTFTLVEFHHMRDPSNVSDISFVGLPVASNVDTTLTDNVTISYTTIDTDLYDYSGKTEYVRFTNFSFSTDATTKKYNMELTLLNETDGLYTNVTPLIRDNIDEHVSGDDLTMDLSLEYFTINYFANIDVTITFVNTTDSTYVINALDDSILRYTDTKERADPFTAPQEIRLAANTAETLSVYLANFSDLHPNIASDLFYGNVLLYKGDGSLQDFVDDTDTWGNISNATDGWVQFANLTPDYQYTVVLGTFTHHEASIPFEADPSTPNVDFITASDNVSLVFDVANVTRAMFNETAVIEKLTFPSFVFTTDATSKVYKMTLSLFDEDETQQQVEFGPVPLGTTNLEIPIDQLTVSIDYFTNYSFTITLSNETDSVEPTGPIGNLSGTLVGMPDLPLPTIVVTSEYVDNIAIRTRYSDENRLILANVLSDLTNDASLYSANIQVSSTRRGETKYFPFPEKRYADYYRHAGVVTHLTLSHLTPETADYKVKFLSFEYIPIAGGPPSPIRFDVVNAPETSANTDMDESVLELNGTPHTRTRSNLNYTSFSIPVNFVVYTETTDYDILLQFYANTDGERAVSFAFSNTVSSFYTYSPSPTYTSPILVNNTTLNYHQAYDVMVTFTGSNGGYDHINPNGYLSLPGSPPVVLNFDPLTEVSDSATAYSLKVKLGTFNNSEVLVTGLGIRLNDPFTLDFRYAKTDSSPYVYIPKQVTNVTLSQMGAFYQITFEDLEPSMSYIIEWMGVTYQGPNSSRLLMSLPATDMSVTTSTLEDDAEATISVSRAITRTLHDQTAQSFVTLPGLSFRNGYPGHNYHLLVNFKAINLSGNPIIIHQIDNIHNHIDGTDKSFSVSTIDYFETYEVTFDYINVTHNSPIAANHPRGTLDANDPLAIPFGFGTITTTSSSIIVPLTFTDFAVNSGKTDSYSFDVVANPDNYRTQIINQSSGYIIETPAVINGVLSDTTYTVTIEDFEHNSSAGTQSGLQFDPGSAPIATGVYTPDDTSVSAIYTSVSTTYMNNDARGYVGNVTFNGFSLTLTGISTVNIHVTFKGSNIEDTDGLMTLYQLTVSKSGVSPSTGTLQITENDFYDAGGYLDYFDNYSVSFEYLDGTTSISSQSMSTGVSAGSAINPPTLSVTKDSESIRVTLSSFTFPTGLPDLFYANVSVSYVEEGNRLYYDNSYKVRTGNRSSLQSPTWTFMGLYENTEHIIQLIDFAHYIDGTGINDAIPIGSFASQEIRETTDRSNVRSVFDDPPITTLLDDYGNIGNIQLNNFTFTQEDSREYHLIVTFEGANITGSLTPGQITAQVDSIDDHAARTALIIQQGTHYEGYLDYFTVYDMRFAYYNVTDDRPADLNVNYIHAWDDIIPAGSAITPPILSPSFTKDSANIQVTLSSFTFPTGLSDSFYANVSVSYVVEGQETYYTNSYQERTGNVWSLQSPTWTFTGLYENTTHTVRLHAFAHSIDGTGINDTIPIGSFSGPDYSLGITTDRSNVRSVFDDPPITTLLDDYGNIGNIQLNNFTFIQEDSREYHLIVTFEGANITGSLTPGQITAQVDSIDDHATGTALIIQQGTHYEGYLDYFTVYDMRFAYYNVTDNLDADLNVNYIHAWDDIIPAGSAITPPILSPSFTKDSESIRVTLSSFTFPTGLSDSFYANLSISYVQEGQTLTYANAYKERFGNMSVLTTWDFTGLYENTEHIIQLIDFAHSIDGTGINDTIPIGSFSGPDYSLGITTDRSNVRSVFDDPPITTLLDEYGNIGNIQLNNFTFTQEDSREYHLIVTFEGANIYGMDGLTTSRITAQVDNIDDHTAETPLIIQQGTHYDGYLDYFTVYDMRFAYYNVTDNLDADLNTGYDHTWSGIIPASPPFTVPWTFNNNDIRDEAGYLILSQFIWDTSDITGITLTGTYSANIAAVPVTDDSGDTVDNSRPVASIYYANQSATDIQNLSEISFGPLVADTKYQLRMLTFEYSVSGLVWDIVKMSRSIVRTVGSINIGFTSSTRTLHNDVAHIDMITLSGFSLEGVPSNVLLYVYFGNSGESYTGETIETVPYVEETLTFIPSSLQLDVSMRSLDYFSDYDVYFQFSTDGGQNKVVDGNSDVMTPGPFAIAAGAPLDGPGILSVSNITSETMEIHLDDFTKPSVFTTSNFDANVSYYPLLPPSDKKYHTIRWDASSGTLTSPVITGLVPNRRYDLELITFEYVNNPSIPFTLPLNIQEDSASDNVSVSYGTPPFTTTLHDYRGYVSNVSIPGFTFAYDGTKYYTLQVIFSQGVDYTTIDVYNEVNDGLTLAQLQVNVSNIQDRSSLTLIKDDFDDTGYYLDFFDDYNIEFSVFNETDQIQVENTDGSTYSVPIRNAIIGNTGIPHPTIGTYTSNADTINVTLSNYPSLPPGVTNNYTANIGYREITEPNWIVKTPLHSGDVRTVSFNSLVPNTQYNFVMFDFYHNEHTQRLLFTPTPDPMNWFSANTASDSVSSSSNPLTRTLLNDSAQTDNITLPGFTFYSNVKTTKDYTANVDIFDSSPTLVRSFNLSTAIDSLNSITLTNTQIGSTINFFEDYTVRFKYYNLTDHTPVYDSIGGSLKYDDFTLPPENNLNVPFDFATTTSTISPTSIRLSGLRFIQDTRITHTPSDNYSLKLKTIPVPGYGDDNPKIYGNLTQSSMLTETANVTFGSLEPFTDYRIEMFDFVHTSTPPNLRYATPSSYGTVKTSKFDMPVLVDSIFGIKYPDKIVMAFARNYPQLNEFENYYVSKVGLENLNSFFKSTFNVISPSHSIINVQTVTPFVNTLKNGEDFAIVNLLPNSVYTVTLTRFEYYSPQYSTGTSWVNQTQRILDNVYTITDDVTIHYDTPAEYLSDNDGNSYLLFSKFRIRYNTYYRYEAEIRYGTTIIYTTAESDGSDREFTDFTATIPYYNRTEAVTVKVRNKSFTNNPYVQTERTDENTPTTDAIYPVALNTNTPPSIAVNVTSIFLTGDNESIQFTYGSGHSFLTPITDFTPNDSYRITIAIRER